MAQEQPNAGAQQQANAIVAMEPGEAAFSAVNVLAKATLRTAKNHPKVTGGWAFGLILVVFATGFAVSPEAAASYERGMEAVDLSEPIGRAASKLARAQNAHYEASGWFWSCDSRCVHYKAEADRARAEFEGLKRQEAAGMSEVKKSVGVSSAYAVAEARDSFWHKFAGGKAFAKRQSMWDLLFTGMRATRRDEQTASIVLRWLMQLLFNFTLGLCGALIAFMWSLWALIQSYQPDPVTGAAFYACAVLAAASMVATYLFAMYFCAASGVAAIGAAAAAQARLEGQRRQDPRYRMEAEARDRARAQQMRARGTGMRQRYY